MDVDELMTGNYILFPLKTDKGLLIPCITRKIDYLDGAIAVSINPHDYPGNYKASLRNCSPIKLTKEWLVNLGYKHTHNLGERKIYRHPEYRAIACESTKELGFAIYFNKETISYKNFVHEFQNLHFVLTGNKLELKK